MVDAISGNAGYTGGTSGASNKTGTSAASQKETFLKLLTAQLAHQDPLSPMDSTQFVSQLAQFSSLEATLDTNAKLDLLGVQQGGIANTTVAGLVGHEVTVKGSSVKLTGQGITATVAYTLNADAATTTLTVRNAEGKIVRHIDAGAHKTGAVQTLWDGKDDSGGLAPTGDYTVTIDAKTADGTPVPVQQETTAKLESVSFEAGYPMLHLSNGVSAPASELIRVGEKDAAQAL